MMREQDIDQRNENGLTGRYGPPPCRKRKTNVTGWSARLYPAFGRHKLLALDGILNALESYILGGVRCSYESLQEGLYAVGSVVVATKSVNFFRFVRSSSVSSSNATPIP
jgi:hypothetical protein